MSQRTLYRLSYDFFTISKRDRPLLKAYRNLFKLFTQGKQRFYQQNSSFCIHCFILYISLHSSLPCLAYLIKMRDNLFFNFFECFRFLCQQARFPIYCCEGIALTSFDMEEGRLRYTRRGGSLNRFPTDQHPLAIFEALSPITATSPTLAKIRGCRAHKVVAL